MKKKLAIVTPGFLPVPAIKGGAVEALVTEIVEQNETFKKYDIDLYTIYDENLQKYDYKYTKIICLKQDKFKTILYKVINKLCQIFHICVHLNEFGNLAAKKISKKEYDYILIENNMYIYKKVLKNYEYNCKKIFHLHNDVGDVDKPKNLCQYIGQNADLVLTVSKYLKNHFMQLAGAKNIRVYYNSIDIEKYSNSIVIDKCKYVNKNDFVFMYVGRISKEKGLLELIKAFKIISNKYSEAKLLVIGDIWYGSKKKSSYLDRIYTEIASIKDKVIFLGSKPSSEMPQFFSIADCVVVPTICQEAFGMVAAEAMASHKALIVAESGGLPEVVDNSCAFVVPINNLIEGIVEKMCILLENKNLSKKMGNAAYKRITMRKDFQSKNYYKELNTFLEELK